MRFSSISLPLLFVFSAFAAPSGPAFQRRDLPTLSPEAVAAFKPYTYFAASAYCDPSELATWSCGANCDANPGFIPTAAGGDGAVTQFWYVGFDPSLDTVIVGHQGTNPEKIIPLLTDATFVPVSLNHELFPGVSRKVMVHAGFKEAHELSASEVLAAVNTTMAKFNTNTITTVGHSLGAAISLLDALFLRLHFPDSIVGYYGYGLPRVGNRKFANLVDQNLDIFSRITNREDPVPTVPPRFLGFRHPSGEDHIVDDGSWKACPGQDNSDDECTDGAVPFFLFGSLSNHDGPYDGVYTKC